MGTFLTPVFFMILLVFVEINVSTCSSTKSKYRLPDNHTPQLYKLNLAANPDLNVFTGNLTITFVTHNETNHILLHVSPTRINITNLIVNSAHVCEPSYSDEDTEILEILCPKSIKKGENNIFFSYTGLFGKTGVDYEYLGFFKASHDTKQGPRNYAATQFQAAFARSAFPCFDEPRFKAEFDITITHPENYNALSNTQIRSQSNINGFVNTKFEKTPPMPSYLIAFVISNFEKTCDNSTEFDLNVYSRRSQVNNTGTAIRYTKKLVDALENWTGIKYKDLGITKLDLVAIPYFTSEAMENWGLITFEEHVLLDEGIKTSAEDKQYIISLISHELSHHWFGNYVTMDWWSNLWLNEGFATYLQFHIPDKVESLGLSRQFITSILHPALEDDDSTGRAMSDPYEDINTGDDIVSVFDVISYNKAACVIRMMKTILGEENFHKGLYSYLQENAYNNTNPIKLLHSLGKYYIDTNLSFEEIMINWIYQPGYPLVTASLNKMKNVVMVYQQEFNHIKDTNKTNELYWEIPITYTSSSNNNLVNDIKYLINKTSLKIPLQNNAWILLNIQQTGYYRVNYDLELWQRIISVLKNGDMNKIHVSNRAQLLDDAFSLAQVGQLDYKIVFKLASYLSKETEYEPWYVATKYFKYIINLLQGNETSKSNQTLQNLKKTVLHWVNTAFPNDAQMKLWTNLQILTNRVIYELKCYVDDVTCLSDSQKTLKKFKATKIVDNYNIRPVALCFGLKNSKTPEEDFNLLLQYYAESDSPIERRVIILSLGCVKDRAILKKYLAELLSNNTIISRPDFRYVIRSVYSYNNQGLEVMLSFLEENLKEILKRYPDLFGLAELIIQPAKGIITNQQLSTLQGLLSRYDDVDDLEVFLDTAEKLPTIYQNRFDTNRINIINALKNVNCSTY